MEKKTFGSMPLTWTKIKEFDDKSDLYLCDQIVAFGRFDAKSNDWHISELRQWLNGEFYETVFSDREREKIVKHKDIDDNVFCLSIDEYNECRDVITCILKGWWLRSPGYSARFAASVNYRGGVGLIGDYVHLSNPGVRPALLLRKE